MNRLGVSVASASILLALAGCDRHVNKASAPSIPEVTAKSAAGLPTFPAWSRDYIGKRTNTGFKMSGDCKGAFDVIKVRYSGSPSGVKAAGWSWDTKANAPAAHILFADSSNTIVGVAETKINRPDVKQSIPIVTADVVGWIGNMTISKGQATAVAILQDGALCDVGSKTL